MELKPQTQDPQIELVEANSGEVTLLIDGGQAMQAWERELMWEMADMLCEYGSEFLEVGLGLGISALRIAENPRTRRHVVVEKYEQVIELFRERHPALPDSLDIVHADIYDFVHDLEPESVDGIFFDPYPTPDRYGGKALEVIPAMARALRIGGVIIPFFSRVPELNKWFEPFFRRVIVERRSFCAYPTTEYMSAMEGTTEDMPATEGTAYIQCFIKTAEPSAG